MTTRWTLVETLRTARQDAERAAVRQALKAGASPLRCYRQDGTLVLQVERPVHWSGRPHEPLTCTIPAAKEAATLAWLARQAA